MDTSTTDGALISHLPSEDKLELHPNLPYRLTKANIDIYSNQDNERFKPTDAFGEIEFEDSDFNVGKLPSKYVRLHEETGEKDLLDLLQKDWDLQTPSLLISVIGGSQDFPVGKRLRNAFSKGIIDAAVSTNGWILTSGTYGGELKYVGEAIIDYQLETGKTGIVAIGIVRWGELEGNTPTGREQKESIWELMKVTNNDERYKFVTMNHHPDQLDGNQLDPNHSHFLLVDIVPETESGSYQDETKFRSRLESAISKNGTDNERKEADLKHGVHDVPVVCIVLSGDSRTIQAATQAVDKGIPVLVVDKTGGAADILARVISSKSAPTVQDLKTKLNISESDAEEVKQQLNHCLGKINLLSIFDETSGDEMNTAILKVLMKAKSNMIQKLMLSLIWNHVEIATSEIFASGETLKLQDEKGHCESLHYALTHNRHEFVKLILENVDLRKYLTRLELKSLYNSTLTSKSLLRSLIEEITGIIEITGKDEQFQLEDVGKVIQRLTIDTYKTYGPDETTIADKIRDLFIFAVLNNFEEMAYVLWQESQEAIGHVGAALIASKIFKAMANLRSVDTDITKCLLENADKYERLAFGVLTQCKENPGKFTTSDLLVRVMPSWGGTTCFSLAESAHNLQFISHPAVQDLLKDKWHGKVSDRSLIRSGFESNVIVPLKFWLCSFLPFLIPYLVHFCEDGKPRHKIRWFYNSPRMIFRHNVGFYLLFLALFSYTMLLGMFPSPIPPLSEWLLIIWVLTLIMEEIRQLTEWESKSLLSRLRGWSSNYWNVIDMIALGLFLIGTGLRFFPLPNFPDGARIILAFDIFIFYFRLLEFLTYYKRIGPKVLMIARMFVDLAFFLGIIFIILIGYGICVHAVLYPHVTRPSLVVESIFYRPYFQIYGELFLEDIQATPSDGTCTFNATAIDLGEEPCPKHSEIGTILLALYLIISNVLLLNLLIAMFSYTFTDVQDKTDLHWKYLRYTLTKEYVRRPILPPPLILISYLRRVWLLIWRCLTGEETQRKETTSSSRSNKLRCHFETAESKLLMKWEDRQTRLFILHSKQKRDKDILIEDLADRLRKIENQINSTESIA